MLITSVTLSINFLFVGAGIRVYPSLQLIQIGHFQIKVRLMLFCIRWVPSYIPLDPILVTSESSLCPESFIFIIFSRLFGLHDLQLAIRQFYFNFYFIFKGKNKIKNKGSSLCFCCTSCMSDKLFSFQLPGREWCEVIEVCLSKFLPYPSFSSV